MVGGKLALLRKQDQNTIKKMMKDGERGREKERKGRVREREREREE